MDPIAAQSQIRILESRELFWTVVIVLLPILTILCGLYLAKLRSDRLALQATVDQHKTEKAQTAETELRGTIESLNRSNAELQETKSTLARMRQDRTITPAQMERIENKLKEFAGQRVWICILRPSDEAERFAGQIHHILTMAGIKAEYGVLVPGIYMRQLRGVTTIARREMPEAQKLAEAIASALNDEQHTAQVDPPQQKTAIPVYVVVREKPQ